MEELAEVASAEVALVEVGPEEVVGMGKVETAVAVMDRAVRAVRVVVGAAVGGRGEAKGRVAAAKTGWGRGTGPSYEPMPNHSGYRYLDLRRRNATIVNSL